MARGSYSRGSSRTVSLHSGGGHARTDTHSGRQPGVPMSDHQIVGFLGRKIYESLNDEHGDLSDVRKESFNFYIGAAYGDEREGYSKFVTREVMETIEWVLPSVLRVFLSGDQVVTFDPEGPEDEAAAKQETDIINYHILKANKGKGFLSLHHWFKDALMYPNGYIKCYMKETARTDVGTLTGITAEGVQMLVDDEDTEILEQESRVVMVEPPAALVGGPVEQVPIEVFDLKVRTTKMVNEMRLDPVPGEEALIDNDCTSLDIDEADFVCHRVRRPYSELVLEGFDQELLDEIGIEEDHQWNDERVNRLFYEDENPDAEDEDDPSMRQFWLHECYVWFDHDGDGIAEHRRVVLIGTTIFENTEVNYQPMVALSSILMQHKHTGMSYTDIVKDLQILQSVLTRQMLDNTYKINVRRKVFSEDSMTDDGSTADAMLNNQAEFIPVRGPAQNAFVPEPTQSVIGEILPVIQYVQESRAMRTGVAPEATLNPEVLQEVTATAFTGAQDQSSQRLEMLVRIFAETGMRFLMLKAHQLLRSHQDIAKTVKIHGKWVNVDPQGWRERTEMTVNVGLGYATKPQQQQMITQLLMVQKEAAAAGLSNPEKIYNSLEKLVNSANIGDVRQYFVDPTSDEYQPPQPQPDANMILAKAQAQALQQEGQRKQAETQADIQLKGQKQQQDAVKGAAELREKQASRALKERELTLKQLELQTSQQMDPAELQEKLAEIRKLNAEITKIEADTEKSYVEAAATAAEAGETVSEARKTIEENKETDTGENDED